jgi:biopolymer transport protein ExbD
MKLARSVRLNPYLVFLVPLVDVIFLLVLLFVVSTTFLLHSGVSVRLPYSIFTFGPEKNPLILTVTAAPFPTIFYRDQPVTLAELTKQLPQESGQDVEVIIRADRDAPQGLVVQVMNVCLERGFNVVLATSSKKE